MERGAIDPDPMENDSNAAREGDHRNLSTTPLRELGFPCSQPCRPATVHYDGRSLAQRSPQIDIPSLSNAAGHITLFRLVARGFQADPGTDPL